MKIVITSNCGPPHKYMWSEIAAQWPETHIMAQTHGAKPTQAKNPWGQRVNSYGAAVLKREFNEIRNLLARRQLNRWKSEAYLKYFSLQNDPQNDASMAGRFSTFTNINSEESVAKIEAIAPDVLVVLGGKILSEAYFTKAKYGTIHLHGGIVPWYRGGNCWTHCIANDDLAHCGPTIQEIDAGIDTGSTIHQHTIKAEPGDTPWDLYGKTIVVGTAMLNRCLEYIEKTQAKIPSHPHTNRGYNYSSRVTNEMNHMQVLNRWHEVVEIFARNPKPYKPRLIQNDNLMIEHPLVNY